MAVKAKKVSVRSEARARKREQEAENSEATDKALANERKPSRRAGGASEATPGEEAGKRLAAGQFAPTSEEIHAQTNMSDAQMLADTAMIMGPDAVEPEEAPSEEDFRADHESQNDPAVVYGVTGRTAYDVQAEQNQQVSMLTATKPPQHIAEQKLEAAQRIRENAPKLSRQGLLPQAGKAMTLEEMGQAKGYGMRT